MEAFLRKPKIFVIYGKARSGKSTVASILRNIYEEKNSLDHKRNSLFCIHA